MLREQRDVLQENNLCVTGPTYVKDWRPCSTSTAATVPAREDLGADVSYQIVTYLRSLACTDPEVFKGTRQENFKEFVRRFKRKYEKVITCKATLLDILGDDHLGGRAKAVFAAIPRFVKEQGLEAVIAEMDKLLACDSVAGRMRALTELRNLRLGSNQEISDFCNVLENLGRQANPDCTIEDRSMEYAQVLLDNLGRWPEHFQLLGALHKVEPRKAYDEIKQLALSIEQSKMMLSAQRKPGVPAWKIRASYYLEQDDGRGRDLSGLDDVVTNKKGPRRDEGEVHQNRVGVTLTGNETQRADREGQGQEKQGSMNLWRKENRKCYNCPRYGHIGRDCPSRFTRVNQIDCGAPESVSKEKKLSEIIRDVRCLGLAVKKGESREEAQLKVVPSSTGNDRIDTEHARGCRMRKPKVGVCQNYAEHFRGARITSPAEKGHLQYACLDECFSEAKRGTIRGISFPGAYARQPISDL
ncbi:zinc knuckle [Ancylostoma duodenale]|uniref:Zinc knuckle n=1 Tax=Ancylostoma duodenale TaxID=51022 RepID=A0A0C2CNA9_9BILA|nr:zinc knuckle [Ancylostoma duodenale]